VTPEQAEAIIASDERQRVEFKKSLALVKDCAKAAVAFANAGGGLIFVGVDDGTRDIVGIDVGKFNRERFANDIESYIYPHLPLFIEDLTCSNGRQIVAVEVPADSPPLVGAYLLGTDKLQPNQRVDASRLQAFRRVGRTSQKVDFMWLRGAQASDPRVLISVTGRKAAPILPASIGGVVWVESGTAHDVSIKADPDVYSSGHNALVLPRSDRVHSMGFDLEVRGSTASTPESLWIKACYRDDWGFGWEAKRLVQLIPEGDIVSAEAGVEFERRIVAFPLKLST